MILRIESQIWMFLLWGRKIFESTIEPTSDRDDNLHGLFA